MPYLAYFEMLTPTTAIIESMKKQNWPKYTFEFLSIFIAVISAFALDNWNDNRRDRYAEVKILAEMRNGLEKDIEDIQLNMDGHNYGIAACDYFSRLITNQTASPDSFPRYYFTLTRDFISIQNRSAYESLKSMGLNLIQNDSLRLQIISFYEYELTNLEKLEERYAEAQFHTSYFNQINDLIFPYYRFDEQGNIQINLPLQLSKNEQTKLGAIFWKIKMNRNFILSYYREVTDKTQALISHIEEEVE